MTLRVLPALVLVIAIFGCLPPATASSSDPLVAVRELGIQIKGAVDRALTGERIDTVSLNRFDHELRHLRTVADQAHDERMARKVLAISALFGALQYRTTHSHSKASNPGMPNRIDREIVTTKHGGTCATALGLSSELPVKLALSASETASSEAWFRYQPTPANSSARFTTDSNGADPELAVYSSCAPGAAIVAFNDDMLGLDASVSVNGTLRTPLFIRVTNTGSAGEVRLGVQSTTGTIGGTITDSITMQPVVGPVVMIFDATSGNFMMQQLLDGNGTYSANIVPGSYLVVARSNNYVSQIYQGIDCLPWTNYYTLQGCPTGQATAVTVTAGATIAGVDFTLDQGHRILGQVRDDSNFPVTANLSLFDSAGNILGTTDSDTFGHYAFATLASGTYKVEAQANGYGSQMYANRACGGTLQTQCDLTQGDLILLTDQDVATINFSLPKLASVYGTINASSQSSYAGVNVVDSFGNPAGQGNADSNGNYRVGPLGPGQYYAYAYANGYFSQMYNGLDCGAACSDFAHATPISITQSGQQVRADFNLHPLPVLSGHVRDAVSGLPLANVAVAVGTNPPQSFFPQSTATTNANGDFALSGVPAGTYYVWAQSNDHVDQIFSGITCEQNNSYAYWHAICDVAGATLLKIAPGQTPPFLDFSLNRSASVSGHAIVRAGPGSNLAAPVNVELVDGSGTVVTSVQTDSLGNYVFGDLAPGTYYADAGTYGQGSFIEQVWQNIDCPSGCPTTIGTPIVLANGEARSNVDFLLTQRNAVVGRVTDAHGDPIGGVLVDLFSAGTSSYLSSGVSNDLGYYAVLGNNAASYIATEAGGRYVDQVYSGVACPSGPAYYGLCPFTNATTINVSSTNTLPQIVDFMLQLPDRIFANGFE